MATGRAKGKGASASDQYTCRMVCGLSQYRLIPARTGQESALAGRRQSSNLPFGVTEETDGAKAVRNNTLNNLLFLTA
jgi:hypothetical protein